MASLLLTSLLVPAGAQTIPELDLSRVDPAVRKQLNDRRAELDAMLARDPQPPAVATALAGMGRLYLAYDYLLASTACLEASQERDPRSFETAYLLGYAYDRQGKPEAAIGAFEKSVEISPDDSAALLRLANHLLAQRRVDEARPLFERAYAVDGECVGALYGLGEVARQTRDHEGAVRFFRLALDQAPGSAQVRYALGQSLRRLGKIEEAAEYLKQADWRQISLGGWLGCADPLVGELAKITTGAPAHLLRGGLATFRGLPELEFEEYRKAVAADPASAQARLHLGMALLRREDLTGAVEQYREAVRLAPTIASYRQDYGQVLEKLGDAEGAEEQFRAAADIDPRFKEPRQKLAEISLRKGRPDDVVRHSRALLEVDPLHRQGRMLLAMALLQLGRRPEAATELGTLMDDHPPEKLEERLQLATMLASLGDLKRARTHISAVHDLATDGATKALALTRLGQLAMARGDRATAVENLRAALALAPDLQEAQAVLAQIEQGG